MFPYAIPEVFARSLFPHAPALPLIGSFFPQSMQAFAPAAIDPRLAVLTSLATLQGAAQLAALQNPMTAALLPYVRPAVWPTFGIGMPPLAI